MLMSIMRCPSSVLHRVGATLLICSTLLFGCSRPPPNVIFILVDTLRADRLGAYANPHGLTPFLDSLAARSFVFRNAYTQAPWTNPSIATLFTSRFPLQHGIDSFASVLQDQEVTLAETLRAHGYDTTAFLANNLMGDRGFGQGFDVFETLFTEGDFTRGARPKVRAGALNDRTLQWLDARPAGAGRPLLLYLHYMEPHSPYAPPQALRDQVADGRQPPDIKIVNSLAILAGGWRLEEYKLREIMEVYDAEVLSLDGELRRLFAELERRGVLRNAIVVFTADHGEAFQEHGFGGHGKVLYDEVLRVPLIVSVPGLSTRVDVDRPVSLIDVAPTLLDWLGIERPPSFEGPSLKPLMLETWPGWLQPLRARWYSSAAEPLPILSERAGLPPRVDGPHIEHQRSLVLGTQKFIAGANGAAEFYDLAADPGEGNSSALAEADRARLRRALGELVAHTAMSAAARHVQPIDEETRERMRALGYQE